MSRPRGGRVPPVRRARMAGATSANGDLKPNPGPAIAAAMDRVNA